MQCWQCGADVQPGERTCSNCGARLTSPPAGRSQRSAQQRYPSPRNAGRRPRNDDWESDEDYAPGDESTYGNAYSRDDRRVDRQRSQPGPDDGWNDPRSSRRPQPRGRSRAGQQPDESNEFAQPGYDQSGYDDDYASQEYGAPAPDPLNDPRAPRNLRPSSRQGPDSRSGFAQSDASSRYSRDSRGGSRDDGPPMPPMPPSAGDSRSRRPPTDPSRDRRRDEGGYRGRGYGQENVLPPLTQESQGYAPEQYDGPPGRPRRQQPSSADNRFGRSSVSRGQASSYNDGFRDDGYGDDYSAEYGAPPDASRRGYGRPGPRDDRSAYQGGGQGGAWQQRWERWGDTISGFRIPGSRQQGESADEKPKSRSLATTIVVLLLLVAVLVAGGVVVAPKILSRLRPSAAASSLCQPSGAAKAGTVPTPPSHFKQFTSARSFYGVNYPETWTVEPQQKVANGYDYIDVYTLPNSSTSVSIEQPEAVCALTDINIIQAEIATAQQQNITFVEDTAAATTPKIGGEQWQRREYDVTAKGVSLHMVILASHHQGRAYVIVMVSRTTTFKQDNTGIFDPMLQSFTFTQ